MLWFSKDDVLNRGANRTKHGLVACAEQDQKKTLEVQVERRSED